MIDYNLSKLESTICLGIVAYMSEDNLIICLITSVWALLLIASEIVRTVVVDMKKARIVEAIVFRLMIKLIKIHSERYMDQFETLQFNHSPNKIFVKISRRIRDDENESFYDKV